MQELVCALKWDCHKLSFNTKLISLVWDFCNVFLLLFMVDLMDLLLKQLEKRNHKTMFITDLAAPVPYKQVF